MSYEQGPDNPAIEEILRELWPDAGNCQGYCPKFVASVSVEHARTMLRKAFAAGKLDTPKQRDEKDEPLGSD